MIRWRSDAKLDGIIVNRILQLRLFFACKGNSLASKETHMTKNIGMLLLAIYLILVGITTLFHIGIGAIVMGVLALIAGILILVGK